LELLSCEDILILGYLRDDRSVGIYSSAVKLVTFVTGVSTFITVALLPLLARLFVESRERLMETSEWVLRFLIIAGIPLSAGMALTSGKVINLLYSPSFHDASTVLSITSWSVAAGFIQIIFAALLTAIDRQKEKMIATAWILAITTFLYVILIGRFSIVGASVAKVASTVISLVFFYCLVSKHLKKLPFLNKLIRPALASLAMSAFLFYFGTWNLFFLIPVSCAIYIVGLLVLGEIGQSEIHYIKKLFPNIAWEK
jgi:O-antigen/teichoic acid export membrane protein